ncbi:1483_t:CDS:2, partial [Diversispora eburnea]
MNYPRKIEITVPCSSSNIGPGFDVLGVTLKLYLSVKLEINEKESNKKIYNDDVVLTYSGEGSDTIPLKIEKNLITKTALYVLACNNISGFTSPMNIHVLNPIPLGRGLGSSGAAVVAGVLLGDIVGNLGLTKNRMLDYCLMIEHHPDNVTAALMGGFIASYSKELGQTDTEAKVIPHSETLDENGNSVIGEVPAPDVPTGIGNYIKLNWSEDIKAITIIPQFEVATATARSVLPDKYDKEDVVFNLQRLAVLTMALSHSPPNPDLIYHVMQDKIHQPYRKHL